MKKLGKKQLTLHLRHPLQRVPEGLDSGNVVLRNGGCDLEYTFDSHEERTGIPELLRGLAERGIEFKDLQTRQSSLEDIFVTLVHTPQ